MAKLLTKVDNLIKLVHKHFFPNIFLWVVPVLPAGKHVFVPNLLFKPSYD